MKRIFFFLGAIVTWLAIGGCNKQFSGARFDSNDQLQIMDYIDERSELSTFKELVEYVGQQNLLKTAGSYTVFAPDNEAFSRLFSDLSVEGNRITKIQDMPPTYWIDYFRYHLLGENKLNTNELMHGPFPVPTAYMEKYIVADISESYAAIRLNNLARVVESNIEFANGYLNILDEVLLPPTRSIYEALSESGNYSTMLGIFEETGYLDYLKDSTITLLVESDEALVRSNFSKDDIEDLEDWVKYHIIPDSGYFLNILTEQRYYSLYDSEALSFHVDGVGQYYANIDYPFNQTRQLGIDRVSSNGIYHTLDTLLEITEAQPATIRLNLLPPGSPFGAQNVFTNLPARIVMNNGTRSYHQNNEFRIVAFDAQYPGDYFWMTVPDVPAGKYKIRLMYRHGAQRGKFLTIYNDEIIADYLDFNIRDGYFELDNYFSYKNSGDITVEERSDVTIYFAFLDYGTNRTPGYCCDMLMDMLDLVPITD